MTRSLLLSFFVFVVSVERNIEWFYEALSFRYKGRTSDLKSLVSELIEVLCG